MSYHGSPTFEAYARTLRRVFWSDFIDAQMSTGNVSLQSGVAQSQQEPQVAVYPLPSRPER